MGKEKTLVKNIGIFAIGIFSSKLLSLLLVRLNTSYITKADYGYYSLIIITTLVAIPVCVLQIMDALYRYLLDTNEPEDSQTAISNAFTVVLCGYFIIGLCLLIANSFFSIKYGSILFPYIVLNVLFTFWQQSARGLKNNKAFSISGIIYSAVLLLANIIFLVVMRLDASALFYSEMAASVVGVLYIESKIGVIGKLRVKLVKSKTIKAMCAYSIPLLPNAIMWWFLVMGSRYLLSYFIGNEANGIYEISAKFPSLLMMVNTVFSYAWQESAITEYTSADRNEYYTRTFKVYMRLLMSALLILIPLTKYLMLILVDSSFGEAWKYVPLLYMGSMFSAFALFYGTGYLSTKKTMGAFVSSIGGTVASILICVVFMPKIGIQAASIANMAAFFLVWIHRVFDTRKYFKIDIDYKSFFSLLALSAVYIYLYFKQNVIIDAVLIAAAVVIFFICNREINGKIINAVKAIYKQSVRGGL